MKMKKKRVEITSTTASETKTEQKIHQNRNKEQFQTVSSTFKAAIDEDGFLREQEREWRRQVLSRFKLSRWADSFNSGKSTNFTFLTTGFLCENYTAPHTYAHAGICIHAKKRKKSDKIVKKHACGLRLYPFITNACIQQTHI